MNEPKGTAHAGPSHLRKRFFDLGARRISQTQYALEIKPPFQLGNKGVHLHRFNRASGHGNHAPSSVPWE